MPICDNCQTAAYDLDPYLFNQLPREEAVATMNAIAVEIGVDLSDHICETVEEPDYAEPCDCSCHPSTAGIPI